MNTITRLSGGRIGGRSMQKVHRVIAPSSAKELGYMLEERLGLTSLPPEKRRVLHVDEFSLAHPGNCGRSAEAEMIDRLAGEGADPRFGRLLQYTIQSALKRMPKTMRQGETLHVPNRVLIGVNFYGPSEELLPHTDDTCDPHVVNAIGLFGTGYFFRTNEYSVDNGEPTPEMVLRRWTIRPGDGMKIVNDPDPSIAMGLPPHAFVNASSDEPRLGIRVEQVYTPQ